MKVFNTKEEWEAFRNDQNTEYVDGELECATEDVQYGSDVFSNEGVYIRIGYEVIHHNRKETYDWENAVHVYPKQVTRTIYTEEK
jgi:hypothetical protein